MVTYDIIYNKFLRLAAAAFLCLKILLQLVAMIFFREAFSIWSIGILLIEGGAIFVLHKGEQELLTAAPFLALALLENILFFCSVDALPQSSSFHLLSLILVATIVTLSMVGRMYENRLKLIFIFALLIACWGYDIFLVFTKIAAGAQLTPATIRMQFLLPLAYGFTAAWAAFPRFRINLTDEEIEDRLEQNRTMLTTGMITMKEYKTTMNMLLRHRSKKG